MSHQILLPQLPRENWCRISPKYCCQICPEKLLPNLTKNIAARAAQRELLPRLTKILLQELIRNKNCCRVSAKNCYESCPERIAAESHQNISVKAVQKNCCRISPKILLQELPRENCCRITPKYCCQSRPEKLLLPRENRCRISPKYCC